MSSKTKIVVLRMKEIIYTAIFAGLGLLLLALLFIMFRPKPDAALTSSAPASYIPGVYTSALSLGSQTVNVEVCVDKEKITAVSCRPLSDAVETMYPLLQPAADQLSAQICATQSLENLTWQEGSQYTSSALIQAASLALEKAKKQ